MNSADFERTSNMNKGRASIWLERKVYIEETGTACGRKEVEGPLGGCFDECFEEGMAGEKNWDAAESRLQESAVDTVLRKSGCSKEGIRYLIGGDLLGQLIGTTSGVQKYEIPFLGIYGACATMGQGIALASLMENAGYGDRILAVTSSHFASAEKQFRFPLDYGNQRAYSAGWTVTGAAAALISTLGGDVRVTGLTIGRIVNLGIKDSSNLGAAMAPAAADVIMQNLIDMDLQPDYYDRIITGDLGRIGQQALLHLLKEEGIDIEQQTLDCGRIIYNEEKQDTHTGGSGCACAGLVLAGHILPKIRSGEWKRVLFVPTGALFSKTSYNEGEGIPGIAYAIMLEQSREQKEN